MKFPNKVVPLKDSLLIKFPIILNLLKEENLTTLELYNKSKKKLNGVVEFIDVLTCLFALGKIDYLDDEVLSYVEKNSMR